jgi:hypothetical protein
VVPSNIVNDLQFKEWDFNIVSLDIVERDLDNEIDTLSDTLQILNDVISQFRLSVTNQQGNYNYLYYLDDTVTCTPFMEKYSDMTNGWTGLIKVKTKTPLDRCAAAYNTFTGTPIYHAGINFKSIIDDFRLLSNYHKQINSFGFGDITEFGYLTDSRDKESNPDNQAPYYPLMFVVPNTATQELQYMTYEFNVIVADIIERDLDNMIDVLSDTNQILDDIISQFRLSVTNSLGNFNQNYYLDDAVTCIPFIEAYQDLLAGWSGTFRIKIMTPLDRCDAAFNDMTGPFPTQNPTPTPTQTPSGTAQPTPTPSVTQTSTPTNTPSETPTNTPTVTQTQTETPTNTPSETPTSTPTNTNTPTQTNTPTTTTTLTSTPTPSVTNTMTPSQTSTNTPTPSVTPTFTPTNSSTPTNTPTPSVTPTFTPTPSSTPSIIPDNCVWNTNNTNWDVEDSLWNVCAIPSIDYITFTSDTASLTTYTFNNVPIGGSGLIAIVVHSESSASRTIASATINGNAATIASQITQGPSASQFTNTGVIYLRVNSGTTANISVTFSGSVTRMGIGVWRIQNNNSDTPVQTQTASLLTGTGLTITFTGLTTYSLGVCGQTNGIANPMTWTNATENYDVQLAALTEMSGANFLTTTTGNRTITTSHSNSTQPLTLVGVVWN